MRILFVWPIVRFSIWDVAVGYRKQLARFLGEENVIDFIYDKRVEYHRRAIESVADASVSRDTALVTKQASEPIVVEALKNNVDIVLIISGKNIHPISLWLLKKVGIPSAVLFTESPYEDTEQIEWFKEADPDLLVLTNESTSAKQHNWIHLPHAFDPDIHHPVVPSERCDVLFIGSGWPERIKLFESIDWAGIDFRIIGIWPGLDKSSKLHQYVKSVQIKNENTPALYCGAKINLSPNRNHNRAQSFGPRCIELAACGAFQISDYRKEAHELFDKSVPLFSSAADLETQIRYFLAHNEVREYLAEESKKRVMKQTFNNRAPLLLQHLQSHISCSVSQKEIV